MVCAGTGDALPGEEAGRCSWDWLPPSESWRGKTSGTRPGLGYCLALTYGAKVELRHWRDIYERRPDGPLDGREYPIVLSETYLPLCRMHINIHIRPWHRNVEHGHGMAPLGQETLVGLRHREGEEGALYPAAVDQEGDVASIGPVQGGGADKPSHRVAAAGSLPGNLQHVTGRFGAVH